MTMKINKAYLVALSVVLILGAIIGTYLGFKTIEIFGFGILTGIVFGVLHKRHTPVCLEKEDEEQNEWRYLGPCC